MSISTKEVLQNHKKIIIDFIKNKIGRVKGIDEFEKRTGHRLSRNVMSTSLRSVRLELEAIQKLDDPDLDDIQELIQWKKKVQKKKFNRHNKKDVVVFEPEPFGIWVIGDPHLDNDGCNFELLLQQMKMVQSSKTRIFASCVGDLSDNWIGRLGVLYSNTSITAEDGWRLSKWFLSQLSWLFFVGGNHDAWASRAGINPLGWLCSLTNVAAYGEDEVRLEIHFNEKEEKYDKIIIQARHDHKGRSWFHSSHGPNKESMLDGEGHIFVSGHIHTWAYLQTEQRHGRLTHAIRVKGYKQIDSYAKKNQFYTQLHGESCLIVIDPKKKGPQRILVFWDLESGIRYLNSIN